MILSGYGMIYCASLPLNTSYRDAITSECHFEFSSRSYGQNRSNNYIKRILIWKIKSFKLLGRTFWEHTVLPTEKKSFRLDHELWMKWVPRQQKASELVFSRTLIDSCIDFTQIQVNFVTVSFILSSLIPNCYNKTESILAFNISYQIIVKRVIECSQKHIYGTWTMRSYKC